MLERMFSSVVTRDALRDILQENNKVFGSQLKREIRDEMHSVVNAAVFASETRVIGTLRAEIHTLRDDILDLVNDEILPQIDQCQRDIVQLKIAVNVA